MIIRLPGCYPVVIESTLAHWCPNGTHHGPQSNPTLVHVSLVKLGCEPLWAADPKFEGWRVWIYFRGGYAWHADLNIDKRDIEPAPRTAKTLFAIGRFALVRR